MTRHWAMPNKHTFRIKPIKELIDKYFDPLGFSIDPFANENNYAQVTNDLDPQYDTDYHMDALDFLTGFETGCADFVFFDPPYSPRQVSESYKKLDMSVNMQTTQASFWGNLKKQIARITAPNGIVMSFGWNSGGIGKTNGFDILEVMLVAHGGWHNDTIVTVEAKL